MKTINARLALCATFLLSALTGCSDGKQASGPGESPARTAGEIHVSPTGDDRAAGTAEAPLRTLPGAIKLAREWRRLAALDPNGEVVVAYPAAAGLDADDPAAARQAAAELVAQAREKVAGGIHIVVHGGRYALTETLFIRSEDSGTMESPTVVMAAGDGEVAVSGGVRVTGWRRQADGLWTAEAPVVDGRMLEFRQMWVNGQKAQRASQLPDGQMERMLAFNAEDESITIPTPPHAAALAGARNLEMVVHQRWAIGILRVKALDVRGSETVVTFHNPESRLEFAHPWPQPVIGEAKGNSGFCLVNALALLDQPGEWYQDYPSGRVYYLPREGEDMTQAEVIVPALERLLTIDGSRERPVRHFAFQGITFEHAAWTRPNREGHVTLQGGFRLLDAYRLPIAGLPEKAGLENQAWIARPEAAIRIGGGSHIDFVGCTFRRMGATGVDYEQAVSHSRVEGCTFTDIGGTALMVGAFPDGGFETHVPYLPDDDWAICHDFSISDNLVTRVTGEDWGAVGIAAGYVRDVSITHNEVSHVNYSGICVGWGWTALVSSMRNNRIEANYVHHFAARLWDAGGVYTLSNQPGSVIARNRIEDLIDAPYATNDRAFYIYFDEATDGFRVEDNWCPEVRFGYNRPGPDLVEVHNGPEVSEDIKHQAGRTWGNEQ